jgi:hypothetical protein
VFSSRFVLLILSIAFTASQTDVFAADNELTAEEKAAGWQLLFNGKDLSGWKNNDGKPLNKEASEGICWSTTQSSATSSFNAT